MSAKVLVADDSSTMRKIILRSLAAVGVPEAVEAGNGDQAIAAFQQEPFDLVLTDWNLSGRSGLEVVQEIAGERQLIRITRFEYFSDTVPGLLERGVEFIEVAGNDEMLVTLLGTQDADYNFEYGDYLFDLPILTQPGQTRSGIKVRVGDLPLFFEELKRREDVRFEHMYDY